MQGSSPGVGSGNPLQYSCLENSMDRRAWRVTVQLGCKALDTIEATEHTHTHYLLNTYLAYNVGDLGSIPGLGISPGEGKGYPLQYSGLKNLMWSMGSQRVRHD